MLGSKQCTPLAHRSRACHVLRSRAVLRCDASSKAKFFIGGNWKSNGTKASVKQLVESLNAGAANIDHSKVDVVVAPTFVHLDYVNQHIDSSKVWVAGQNLSLKGTGAFTGEIAAETLLDMGVSWVIIGHSERRQMCGETNEVVAMKTNRALEMGMSVIPCIGESLEQRQSGEMFKVLEAQVQALIDHIKDWSRVVIAYEPIWAIGTGVVATPEQVEEVHLYLRQLIERKVSKEIASTLRILYGGSVNDKNCAELAALPDVDGFLVGGASLQAPAFLTIIASHKVKQQQAAKV